MKKLTDFTLYGNHQVNQQALFIEHGADLDNILYKMNLYTRRNLTRNDAINEAFDVEDVEFTITEQQVARDYFVCICESYIDELMIEENKLVDSIKNLYGKAKEKVVKGIEALKIKIKEIAQFIKDIASKAIKTIKDMVARLMSILEKFDCTIKGLFKKIGWNTDKLEEDWDAEAKELAKNPDQLKKEDVYESFGAALRTDDMFIIESMIDEKLWNPFGKKKDDDSDNDNDDDNDSNDSDDDNEDNSSTRQQSKKTGIKAALWKMFKQLAIWATVCVVIPGTVVAVFPGTFIALLVPMACKLAWNGYKIVKLWKQFKKVKSEWHSYKTGQKWLNVIGMVGSVIGICFNFHAVFSQGSTVLKAFQETGCKLLGKANLGISPDMLTKGFAAALQNVMHGKWPWDDFSQVYDGITESFAVQLHFKTPDIDIAASTKGMDAEGIKSAQNAIHDGMQGVPASKWGEKLQELFPGLKDKLPAGYNYFCDNVKFPGGVDRILATDLGKQWMDEYGDQFTRIATQSANKLGKTYSALYAFKEGVSGEKAMKALQKVMEKVAGNGELTELGNTFATHIAGTVINTLGPVTDMMFALPIVEFDFDNEGGFKVRLGGEDEKDNYVYTVGKDDVKDEKLSKMRTKIEKHNQAALDKLDKGLEDAKKKLEESKKDLEDADEKEKKKAEKNIKKIQEKIDKFDDVIVFYGTRDKVNESLSDLFDDNEIITEGLTNANIHKAVVKLAEYFGHRKGGDLKAVFTSGNEHEQTVEEIAKLFDNTNFDFGDDKEAPVAIVKNLLDVQKAGTDDKGKSKDENNDMSREDKDKYIIVLKCLQKDKQFLSDVKKKNHLLSLDAICLNDKELRKLFDNMSDDKVEKEEEKAEDKKEDVITPPPFEETDDDNDSSSDEGSSDDKHDDEDDTDSDDNQNQAILFFSPAFMFGADLAKADKQGPRKDTYPMNGMYKYLTFMEMKGGMSKANISKFLSKIMSDSARITSELVVDKPAQPEDKSGKKWKVMDYSKDGDDRHDKRDEFGGLTNNDITDILNNPEKCDKYLEGKGGKVSTAETPDEKKELAKIKENEKKTVKDDDEIRDYIKNSKTLNKHDVVDEDGNIDDKKLDDLLDNVSEYHYGQIKNKKKKGFWAKLKAFFFGDDSDYDEDEVKELDKRIAAYQKEHKTNEAFSLNAYLKNNTINEGYRSLADYIRNKSI